MESVISSFLQINDIYELTVWCMVFERTYMNSEFMDDTGLECDWNVGQVLDDIQTKVQLAKDSIATPQGQLEVLWL